MVSNGPGPCRTPGATRRRGGLPSGERGSVALEFAILFPLVLVLTFGGVQVAFWFQARAMCQAAAQVSESPTPTAVSVRCSGTALQVMPLPGLPLSVAQSAAAGREQFTHR